MGTQPRDRDFLIGWRHGTGFCWGRALARCPAAPALRGAGLLAHEPQLLFDSSRHAAHHFHREPRVVPLDCGTTASRALEFQSSDPTGPGFPAGLLGPHRTGLRQVLDPTQAQPEHPNRILGIAGDLPRNAAARVPAHADEGARRRNASLASESGPRQLTTFVIPKRSEGSWFLFAALIVAVQAKTMIPRFARDDNP